MLCKATAISCRPVLEDEMDWQAGANRVPPRTAIAGHAPSAGGGQFWLVLAGDATVDGEDPLPANSCIFVGPEDPPLPAPQALSAPNCCACNSVAARGVEPRPLRAHQLVGQTGGRPCRSSTFRFIPSIEIILAGRGPVPRTDSLPHRRRDGRRHEQCRRRRAIMVSSFSAYEYDPSYALEVYKPIRTSFGW